MNLAYSMDRLHAGDSGVAHRLRDQLNGRPITLLGIGPMSRVCVDATVDLATEHRINLMLVASRRQIESAAFGGGYVERWSTEEFCAYVQGRDPQGRVVLCRDHGGPWQGDGEATLDAEAAMKRAKQSYDADIASGMTIIHLDPSLDPHRAPGAEKMPLSTVLSRLFDLYVHCWETAQRLKRDIAFEIGTEEQDSFAGDLGELAETLASVERFCRQERLPLPLFAVAQTGTKVAEMRNIGSFGSPFRIEHELPAEVHVPRVVGLLRRFGLHLKQHNTDYLTDEALSWMPRLGVSSANVAPEFGVAESRALVEVLERNNLMALRDRFLELSLKSGKWRKWMVPETRADDRDRALISGHYVFAKPEFVALADEARRTLARLGVDLDVALRSRVREAIVRYLVAFRLAPGLAVGR